MGELEKIDSWITSENYLYLLSCLSEQLGLRIDHGSVPEILLRFDADSLGLSGLQVAQISSIAENSKLVINYVREKLKSLEGTADEQEGMHPEDEESVLLEELPFYKNFLNSYLIELHFLIFDLKGLAPYLKAIRIPKAKEYAKLLSDAYGRAS